VGTGQFDLVNIPQGPLASISMVVNPAAAEATLFTAFDPGDHFQYNTLTVDEGEEPVVFSNGASSGISGIEDQAHTLMATFTGPAGAYSASIAWGDSSPDTAASVMLIGPNTEGGFDYAIVTSHTYTTQGTFTGGLITVTNASDSNGNGTIAFTATISDIPLDITNFSVTRLPLRFALATATFTDDPGLAASTFTASINWGDGVTSNALVVADPTQAGRFLVIGLHRYSARGTYNVTLTVNTNEAGASILDGTASTTVTI
jgi:hypothetical protein